MFIVLIPSNEKRRGLIKRQNDFLQRKGTATKRFEARIIHMRFMNREVRRARKENKKIKENFAEISERFWQSPLSNGLADFAFFAVEKFSDQR